MLLLKAAIVKISASAVCTLLVITSALARAEDRTPRQFDISEQSLAAALTEFARQSQHEILFSPQIVTDKKSDGIRGTYPPLIALQSILQGSGLEFSTTPSGAILIQAPGSATLDGRTTGSAGGSGSALRSGWFSSYRMAQAEQESRGRDRSLDNAARVSEGKPTSALEEIIVTAQKREERVQDIPMSIAVISNQDIERRGLIGMADYLRAVPSVNQIERGFDNAIVIRGVTTQLQQESGSSGATVGTYFGETPLTGSGGLAGGVIDIRPVDVERIEILRGPQGTSYGSSSLGGTVRVIPKKPDLDRFGGNVGISHSETGGRGSDNSMMQGVLNVPLVEGKFAIRALGYRFDESGIYRNVAGEDPTTIAFADGFGLADYVRDYRQDDVGRARSTGGRIAASWQPIDALNVTVTHLTQDFEQDGRLEASFRGTYDQRRFPVAPQARTRGQSGEINDTNIDLSNLVVNYDLGWGAITSSSSWIDSGSIFVSAFGPTGVTALGPSSVSSPSDFQAFSTETRFASNFDGKFQFLTGVFYEDIESSYEQTYYWPGPPQTNPAGPNPTMGYFESTRQTDQRAVFGEVSYQLTDTVAATLGGRYFMYDKKERTLSEGGLAGGVPIGGGMPVDLDSEESDSNFKASVNYKPTQDAMMYASWAQGFRLGRPQNLSVLRFRCDTDNDGFVDGSSVAIGSLGTIDSDFLDNYEVGGKVALFDRRLTIDAAIYHIEWDGLPATQLVSGCTATYTANAGAATSDGLELQASLFLTDGLRVYVGGAYTKAELSEDVPVQGWREGDRLPGSPKVSANLAVQYDFDVFGYSTFVRADSLYTGEFYANLLQSPVTRAGDYVKVDARAGVAMGKMNLELFVKNLTNNNALTWQSSLVDFVGYQLRPRTIGLQLGYSFQ